MAPEPTYVLYTYQTVNAQLVCHAYTTDSSGSALSQSAAEAAGAKLKAAAGEPSLGYMVLEAEALPA